LLILTLSTLLATAPAAHGEETWEKEIKASAGQKIELKMKKGGSLKAEGWDNDVVRILCLDSANELGGYGFKVSESQRGYKLTVDYDDERSQTNNLVVRLMVPREFDIETNSAGGSISISDVSGKFEGRTGGGRITLSNLSGKVNLSTGGGYITVVDSDLDGKVSSGGGGGVMRNVTGNLKATSGGGVVSYENVRDKHGDLRGPRGMSTTGVSPGTVMYSSAGGGIDLDEAPEGAMVRTGGGEIRIRNASRFVKANTGGGDIDIEIEDGYVVANTGAGDIEVEVEGGLGESRDGIDLSTGHGEITVTLPPDASIELDLELAYTRNSSRNYEIECDFDLELEHTQEWDTSNGSPRKFIYGTASLNGGKHRVIIHNVNGDIRIRKQQ
jgi:DUF4097 and DUF4098 domain-containing protein YvlB